MKISIILLLSLFFIACNRPDAQPQLKDPIYRDIQAEVLSLQQALDSENKNLDDNLKALSEVVPQTGQIKYAQKRVDESKAAIQKISQELEYQRIKLAAREKETKSAYLKAFKAEEEWPDPTEWEQYLTEKRLRNAKRSWDVKNRIQELAPNMIEEPFTE